jgi:hypothetical protein
MDTTELGSRSGSDCQEIRNSYGVRVRTIYYSIPFHIYRLK